MVLWYCKYAQTNFPVFFKYISSIFLFIWLTNLKFLKILKIWKSRDSEKNLNISPKIWNLKMFLKKMKESENLKNFTPTMHSKWSSYDPQMTFKLPSYDPNWNFWQVAKKMDFLNTKFEMFFNFFDILILDLGSQILDLLSDSQISFIFSDFEMFFWDIFWSFQYFFTALEREHPQYFSTHFVTFL